MVTIHGLLRKRRRLTTIVSRLLFKRMKSSRAGFLYYNNTNPTEEDRFLYTEALEFLIRETKDDNYMVELGAFYYEQRRFDLALKYYELAAESDNLYAICDLGYIWYYGRTGERDYEKAFACFDKARQMCYVSLSILFFYISANLFLRGAQRSGRLHFHGYSPRRKAKCFRRCFSFYTPRKIGAEDRITSAGSAGEIARFDRAGVLPAAVIYEHCLIV